MSRPPALELTGHRASRGPGAPAPPAPRGGATRGGASRGRASRRFHHLRPSPAEVALLLVTLAAAVGLERLFQGLEAAPALLGTAVAAHALALAGRRWSLGPAAVAGLAVAGLGLALAWLVVPATTLWGLPTPSTARTLAGHLGDAWERFGEVRAPAGLTPGFLGGVVAGTWVAAWSADTFAFRLQARFEALAPSFTMVMFTTVLAAGGWRVPAAAAYLASVVAFATLTEVERRRRRPRWLAGHAGPGTRRLAARGLALGGVAVVLAVVVGPHLPGTGAGGLLDERDGRRDDAARVTVSPLVDIRSRLVDQSDTELFTVTADEASYWRLTSLEAFDGTIWSASGRYRETDGELPTDATAGPADRLVTQRFTIGPLATIWLPSAFRPVAVSGPDGVRFDPDSASLLSPADTAEGLSYEVTAAITTVSGLGPGPPGGPTLGDEARARYTALPDGVTPVLDAVAREVVGTAADPFTQALALQEWFRSSFTYDLRVPPGHSTDAIEAFLASRRGYCEQFSGTFAAMARSLGIPARVAVGFVAGDDLGGGRYRVAGRDAHAWPEVFLAGWGWVAFEPTPGRPVPGVPDHTGVGEQPAATGQPEPAPAPTPTTAPGAAGADPGAPSGSAPDTGGESPAAGGGATGRAPLLVVALLVAGTAVAVYAGALAGARHLLWRRRRARATGPAEAVLVAWQEAEEALAAGGRRRRGAETRLEFATRQGDGGAGAALGRLASLGTAAGFAVRPLGEEEVAAAWATSAEVRRAARHELGRRARLRLALDPRNWPGRAGG